MNSTTYGFLQVRSNFRATTLLPLKFLFNVTCPAKIPQFRLIVSSVTILAGNGTRNDESIEVYGRAEGVHSEKG